MELMQAIRGRRSVRAFLDKKIPARAIADLKQALLWAPSAGNLQSRKFFFVYNDAVKRILCDAALGQEFVAEAPLVVVACVDYAAISHYGERGRSLYALLDVAAAVQNLLLAAHALGLGSVWVGAFDERAVSEALSLPENLRPVTLAPIGFPAESPKAPARKSERNLIQEIT